MVFIDAENVSRRLAKKFYEIHEDEQYHVYGKKSSVSNFYSKFKHVKLHYCLGEKNSADMFMTTDIVKSLYEDDINIYYIISQDRDFTAAVKAITEKKKEVILVSCLSNRLKNLKEMGIDLNYVELYEIDDSYNGLDLEKVRSTKDTKSIYNMCKDRVWIKGITKIIEMPFQNGMHISRAKRFLSNYRKDLRVGSSISWEDVFTRSYLKVKNGRLYYYTENELRNLPKKC